MGSDSYRYRDESGALLYTVHRAAGKKFRQEAADGAQSLGGIRRVPYRLPELIAARDRGETVYVVEGEKDADNLAALGYAATTNSGGSGWRWPDDWRSFFEGCVRVVVIADCDKPGRKAAHDRAGLIADVCGDVRLLDISPDRDDGFDASDLLASGGADALLSAIEDAPRFEARQNDGVSPSWALRTAAEIKAQPPEPVSWDVEGLIQSEDGPALLFGPPGALKSFLALHISTCIVTGAPVLGRFPVRKRARAIFVNFDAGKTALERRVLQITDSPALAVTSPDGYDAELLRALIAGNPGAWIVLDSFADMHNPGSEDKAQAMRRFLRDLRALFSQYGCNGLVLDHPHRPKDANTEGDYHGTVQKEATIRQMLRITPLPTDREYIKKSKLVCRKMSEGEMFEPFAFAVDFTPGERIAFLYDGALAERGTKEAGPTDAEQVEALLHGVPEGMKQVAISTRLSWNKNRTLNALKASRALPVGQGKNTRYVMPDSSSENDERKDEPTSLGFRIESAAPDSSVSSSTLESRTNRMNGQVHGDSSRPGDASHDEAQGAE